MTSPNYRPPPVVGWWVKNNQVAFVEPAEETWTGHVPASWQGKVATPPAATETWTGSTPGNWQGPFTTPPPAEETWTGTIPTFILSQPVPPATETWTGTIARGGAQYSDDFNRADSTTTLGSNWTAQQGTMGINANGAYGAVPNTEPFATYVRGMIYDNMRVTVVPGTENGSHRIYLVIGANTTGQCAILSLDSSGTFTIGTKTSWASGIVTRASRIGQTIVVGATYTFTRNGNVYVANVNSGPIGAGLTWTDGTDVIPRDSSHRLVGIGALNGTGALHYQRIDSWSAEDNI